jgi:hypothetical protein
MSRRDYLVLRDCTIAIMRAYSTVEPRPAPRVRFRWSRQTWVEIGTALRLARETCGSHAAFDAWIQASGIDRIPGLVSPISRYDAMWMAEYPDRVALVDERFSHPRRVRDAWRRLFIISLSDCVDRIDDFPPCQAAIEYWAECLAIITGAGFDDSVAAITAAIASRQLAA